MNEIHEKIKPFSIEITENEVVISDTYKVLKRFDMDHYNVLPQLVNYLAVELKLSSEALLYTDDELSDICYQAQFPCGAML